MNFPAYAAGLSGRTILVVDDEPLVKESLQLLFETQQCRVLLAESGEVALDILAAHEPELLILDMVLPDTDGWELFRRIRTLDIGKKTPVIFLTGTLAPENEEALPEGEPPKSLFLAKPIPPVRLIDAVARMLGLHLTSDSPKTY
jgi:CheY-like chemotaxis protein